MALTDRHSHVPLVSDTRRTVVLIIGDTLAFIAFATIGLASHNELADHAIVKIIETAAPFAIGWFAIAPFAGAFKPQTGTPARAMLARTALTWLPAWLIGLTLRALIRQSGVPPISFAIITFLTVLLLLCGWRGVFARVENTRQTKQP